MKIGIKHEFDKKTMDFYEENYDILRTPDFNDRSRLLTPQNKIQFIGDPHNKVCRFCGKKDGEVTFKKIAHVFPEAIGNNVLASYYECDTCNQFFGNTIENDYSKFFALYHSVLQIEGKRGVPSCKFKVPCDKRTDTCADHCIEINFGAKPPSVKQCKESINSKYVKISENSIVLSRPVGNCCPIAVFKAIVKMAITVMPIEELQLFQNTIRWLLENSHNNIFSKKLLVRYQMIPGFDVTKYVHYCLYRRKKVVWDKPYMLFHLTYGCFSLLIEVPRDNSMTDVDDFVSIPFPPIPFYASTEGYWDLSDTVAPKGMTNSVTLDFEGIEEVYNAADNNGKTIDIDDPFTKI